MLRPVSFREIGSLYNYHAWIDRGLDYEIHYSRSRLSSRPSLVAIIVRLQIALPSALNAARAFSHT